MATEEQYSRFVSTPVAYEIEFLLARARSLGTGRANAALEALGLKVRHYALLSLAVSNVQPTQRELAVFLKLDPNLIVSVIDDLERLGWIERQPSQSDRRSKIVVATEAGLLKFPELRARMHEASKDSFGFLNFEERATLRELLRRISFFDIVTHPVVTDLASVGFADADADDRMSAM